jgi:erythritol transport system ATP-binding protein
MTEVLLEARGIVRLYPGNVALKGVDFRIYRNKVNVLIGENGAGKSTLMRILSGVEQADEGEVLLDGKPVQIRSPREATVLGIAIMHQELSVLPNLDVTENIFAGRELLKSLLVVDKLSEDRRSQRALERLQQHLNVDRQVSQLSLGTRQMVELARTIAHGSRVLILDEPTSALSITEAAALFRVVEELKASGVSIVYISHRLHELLHLGDYFTVLRSGQVVGEAPREHVTREWIVQRMSGRTDEGASSCCSAPRNAEVVLEVRGLTLTPSVGDEAAQAPVHDVHLSLRRGEILGVYGLLGAGRTELLEALAGHRKLEAGKILVQGKDVQLRSVSDAVRAGLVLVPEDRQRDGLIPDLSIRENIALVSRSGPVYSRQKEAERVRSLVRDLQIRANDLELPVVALSGGNQQKVLLARCLMCNPVVLMLDEPTRGVDVAAKAEIYRILKTLASKGLSILFTSSEIEETRLLADRALVLCQGRVRLELQKTDVTDEALFAAASPDIIGTQRLEGAPA